MAKLDDQIKGPPKLPKNTTANQLLNDFSAADRKKLASTAGMDAAAYDAFLEKLAGKQRLSRSVASIKAQIAPVIVEKDRPTLQAESEIIRGIQAIDILNRKPLSTEDMEKNDAEAFRMLDNAEYFERNQLWVQVDHSRHIARKLFRENILSRTIIALFKLRDKGIAPREARRQILNTLKAEGELDNVPQRNYARDGVAFEIGKNLQDAEVLHDLNQMVLNHESQTMSAEQEDLMHKIVQCMKTAYIRGKLSEELMRQFSLEGYHAVLPRLFKMYKKHGPMRTTADKVSGPAEVFEPTQTGEEKGYRPTGKRRPHRGTSGGSDDRF